MSSKLLRCEFSSNTFESSRFESCFQYEKEIAKHFQGKRAISRAIIAWNFKKHHFPKGLSPFCTRKCFRRNKYATYGLRATLQYHSTINVNQTLSFDPSNFRQRPLSRPISEVLGSVTQLTRHDWEWGSEPIFAVLQCKANSRRNRSKLPTFHPLAKISLISKRTRGPRIRY